MTKPTHSDREKFIAQLVKHAPAADYRVGARLMRLSGTYARYRGELQGEEVFPSADLATKYHRTLSKIEDLARDIRCAVMFADGVVKLVLPNEVEIVVPGI